MTGLTNKPRRMVGAALALGALQLAACASGPAKVAAPVAAPPPPEAPPAVVTMAPIPNPVETPSHERRSAARSRPTAAKHEHVKAPSAPAAPAGPAASTSPAANPVKAARLRARGLEELDRGAVARAVALLTEASQLDPANTLIRHDLDRAERISRAVHNSK